MNIGRTLTKPVFLNRLCFEHYTVPVPGIHIPPCVTHVAIVSVSTPRLRKPSVRKRIWKVCNLCAYFIFHFLLRECLDLRQFLLNIYFSFAKPLKCEHKNQREIWNGEAIFVRCNKCSHAPLKSRNFPSRARLTLHLSKTFDRPSAEKQ